MFAEKSQHSYDKQARYYDSDSNRNGRIARQIYDQMIDRISSLRYASLLDVGCGTGEMLSRVQAGDVKLSGIDISSQMIDVARQKLGDGYDLRAGDATVLPWDACSFDVVICSYSFHHYEHPEKVLGEMHRVLKEKGRLIIGDCWAPTPVRQITNLFIKFSDDGDYHIYSKGEICKLLRRSGFTVTEWSRTKEHSMIVTAIPTKNKC